MEKEKDEVSTRLRLPIGLHHRLSVLANADKRSLHSLMVKVLDDYVIAMEIEMASKYENDDEFFEAYKYLFGDDYSPIIDKIGLLHGLPCSTGRIPRITDMQSQIGKAVHNVNKDEN